MVEGHLQLWDGKRPMAVVGQGVQFALGISTAHEFIPLQVFYPKNLRSRSLDPNRALSRKALGVAGVFAIERAFDEKYVLVPLSFARELLRYNNKVTALEITLHNSHDETL